MSRRVDAVRPSACCPLPSMPAVPAPRGAACRGQHGSYRAEGCLRPSPLPAPASTPFGICLLQSSDQFIVRGSELRAMHVHRHPSSSGTPEEGRRFMVGSMRHGSAPRMVAMKECCKVRILPKYQPG